MQVNGDLILNEYTAADSAIYDCIVCSSSGDALTFISAVKTQVKRSGSRLVLELLETEFGSATEANQLAIQAQMHAVSFSGDLKDYLLKLDLLRRKLTGNFVLPYSTLLHIVKNACIHAHQMEIKQADKIANKNFDTFLTEMRATAQDLATYAKSSSSAKAFAAQQLTLPPSPPKIGTGSRQVYARLNGRLPFVIRQTIVFLLL